MKQGAVKVLITLIGCLLGMAVFMLMLYDSLGALRQLNVTGPCSPSYANALKVSAGAASKFLIGANATLWMDQQCSAHPASNPFYSVNMTLVSTGAAR
jgi:cell division septal protein FtsQ